MATVATEAMVTRVMDTRNIRMAPTAEVTGAREAMADTEATADTVVMADMADVVVTVVDMVATAVDTVAAVVTVVMVDMVAIKPHPPCE